MDLHIQKMEEFENQERKESRQEGHAAFVEKLMHSADGGAKTLHNITNPTPWTGAALFRTPEVGAAEGREGGREGGE